MTTISVIIPFFRAEFFGTAIASVLAQTHPPDEIIVIDDGAPFEDSEQLRCYAKSISIIHQSNQGPGAARNAGIAAAKSEWIAFLDDDDAWEPERLRLLYDFIVAHPECNVLHNAVRLFGTDVIYWKSALTLRDFLTTYPSPAKPSSVMIRRSVLLQAGLMNPALPLSEDYDCFLRVAITHRFHCVNVPLTQRRKHANSLSQQFETKYRIRNRLLYLYSHLYESDAERIAFAVHLNSFFLASALQRHNWRASVEIGKLGHAHGVSTIRIVLHAVKLLVSRLWNQWKSPPHR